MVQGWRYRLAGVGGTVCITAGIVSVANHPLIQRSLVELPVVGRLRPTSLSNGALSLAVATAVAVVLVGAYPLFKPRPRRALDTIALAERRVVVVVFALAAVGYFDYTYRLPRTTLIALAGGLGVVLPAWFLLIRRDSERSTERAVVVGDDPSNVADVLSAIDVPVAGYVSPSPSHRSNGDDQRIELGDGGRVVEPPREPERTALDDLECLGGLSRLDDVIVGQGIDTAVLAFNDHTRTEFFGVLSSCHEHGITAMVHEDHAAPILTTDAQRGKLVEIDLEPLEWQDHVLKRVFDLLFALIGIIGFAPVMILIAVAIKLDSSGPVLYGQERTSILGETFKIYKFRSMIPDAESKTGAVLSNEDAEQRDPRVTRVGRVLRETHLDELPQLWSILIADMSVVGPRPERPAIDTDIENSIQQWRQRWFVRPGLTGLAQINNVTGYEPRRKLRYDVIYIRNQSFWFDLKIVTRQIWQVVRDVIRLLGFGNGDIEDEGQRRGNDP
jgi:lipopolysaccharide/colanic/teichoic acid biosynthesis glycosyltransferase